MKNLLTGDVSQEFNYSFNDFETEDDYTTACEAEIKNIMYQNYTTDDKVLIYNRIDPEFSKL
jgi:hypothetical protein